MENAVLQRIDLIIRHYEISRRRFCKRIGMSQSTLSSMFKRDSDPKMSQIDMILDGFPEIRKEWLLEGKEPMLKSSLRPSSDNEDSGVIIQSLIATVKSQQETIASQQETIARLSAELKKMAVSPVGIADAV